MKMVFKNKFYNLFFVVTANNVSCIYMASKLLMNKLERTSKCHVERRINHDKKPDRLAEYANQW